jgi:RHS repeat-associated protein
VKTVIGFLEMFLSSEAGSCRRDPMFPPAFEFFVFRFPRSMKYKWPLLTLLLGIATAAPVLAQANLNVDNTIKAGGSFNGSSVDTVNLQNGNLLLHIPLPLDHPQRGGSIAPKHFLTVAAKTWRVNNPGANTLWWTPADPCLGGQGPCGQGAIFLSDATFSMTRQYNGVSDPVSGGSEDITDPDTLTTWDGATHPLIAIATNGTNATVLVTSDGSGYRVELANDAAMRLGYGSGTVIDRDGNRYGGGFEGVGPCKVTQGSPGGIQGSETTTTTCNYAFIVRNISDPNGNIYSGTTDTLGRPAISIPSLTAPGNGGPTVGPTQSGDLSGCFNSFGTPWVEFFSYPAPNATTNQIKMCFSPYPSLVTSFSQPNVVQFQDQNNTSRPPVYLTNVFLPDQTQWQLSYDSYGEITKLSTPTGASISYHWQEVASPSCGSLTQVSRAVATRTLKDINGNSFIWTYHWGTQASDGSLTNSVVDPNGNETVHTFRTISAQPPPSTYCNFYETSTLFYQGPSSSNQLMKRVDTTYQVDAGNRAVLPTSVQTTLYPGRKVSLLQMFYDTGNFPGVPTVSNVTQDLEYDFGPGAHGPLLRQTDTTYQWQADSTGSYNSANLLTLESSVVICSPKDSSYNPTTTVPLTPCNQKTSSFTKLEESDFGYDDPARLVAGGVGTQHGPAPAAVRGNLTARSRWLNTDGSFITDHTDWLDTGVPSKTTDPMGHASTFSYSAAFAGAYATSACDPLQHCVTSNYDFNTGLLASFTDQNSKTSSYGYDLMSRLTSASSPDGGSETLRYPNSTTTERLKTITSSLTDDSFIYSDGLGRAVRAVHVTPQGQATVVTSYDGLGQAISVTNPYYSSSDPTYGVTATQYDALGQVTQTTKADGGLFTTSYADNCSTGTDEAGKTRKLCSDALGRLIEVDEPWAPFAGKQATGGVTVGGTLRSTTTPGSTATYATGWVRVNGLDHTTTKTTTCTAFQVKTGTCDNTGTTTIDTGTVCITVGVGYCYTFGNGSVPDSAANVAANLASQVHNGTSAVDGFVDPSNTAQVDLKARTAGSAGNVAFSSSPASSVDFSTTNSGTGLTGGADGTNSVTTNDAGLVTINVGGFTATACYGKSTNAQCTGQTIINTNSSQVASALVAGLNAAPSPVTASVSGSTDSLVYKTVGQAGNVTISIASQPDSQAVFPGGSFSGSGALSGGTDADSTGLATPYVTLYRYDGLGNLLQVTQQGGTTDQTQWRVRSFQYDSLSRLTSAFNPEAGQISYTYNADGLVIGRDRPRANQADPSILTHTTYGYDSDHHLTSLSYGDATGTNAVFNYNQSAAAGLSISNPLDRLTSQTNSSSTQAFSYDSMGRVLTIRNVIGSISKDIGYRYNLNGSLAKLIYPSLAAVDYTPDSAGRILSAVDSGHGINYVTQATYNAPGEITGYINGGGISTAGITTSFSYNQRTQPVFLQASTPVQTVLSIGYDFRLSQGDNGDVLQRTNNLDPTRNQTFTYDALNRLSSAQNSGTDCTQTTSGGQSKFWGTTYAYDPWGNLLSKNLSKCSAPPLSVAVNAANRIIGYGYDAAGNLLNTGAGSASSTYDAAGRITSAGGYSYGYDAGGNRVSKSAGSMGTLYWFGTPGIVAESDLAGNIQHEYAFMGGKRVARRDSTGDVFYYFSDFLNSTSVVADASGNVVSDSDYLPWGEEQVFKNTSDNHFKFDGKERDAETGNDNFGARYYANAMGRFTSPDWSASAEPVPYARLGNPQSLNLYSFAWNNPESSSDRNGHAVTTSEDDLIDCKKDKSNPKCVQRSKKSTCDGPGECAHRDFSRLRPLPFAKPRDYSRLPIPILKPWVLPPPFRIGDPSPPLYMGPKQPTVGPQKRHCCVRWDVSNPDDPHLVYTDDGKRVGPEPDDTERSNEQPEFPGEPARNPRQTAWPSNWYELEFP